MANYSAVLSVGPKSVSGVDQVTLTGEHRFIDIHNLDNDGSLTVTAARGSAPANPVAGANDNLLVPAGCSRTIEVPGSTSESGGSANDVIVKVAGTNVPYLIEGIG